MKACTQCKIEKLEIEFAWKSKAKGKRSSWCKECHCKYTEEHYGTNVQSYVDKAKRNNGLRRTANRELIIEYLRSHPCVDCGNSDIEVLQFDHRDRTEKIESISRMLTQSVNRVVSEIAKCDIRCANCHVKRSRRQMGWWIDDMPV